MLASSSRSISVSDKIVSIFLLTLLSLLLQSCTFTKEVIYAKYAINTTQAQLHIQDLLIRDYCYHPTFAAVCIDHAAQNLACADNQIKITFEGSAGYLQEC